MITKLSNVFGKEVYSLSGTRVGRVTDVAIEVDTRRVSDILISNLDQEFKKRHGLEGRKGVIYSYKGIRSVHDIVLISDIKTPKIQESEEQPPVAEANVDDVPTVITE